MSHQRCEVDRRAVRVRVTARGRLIRDIIAGLFVRHARGLEAGGALAAADLAEVVATLKRIEQFWSGQIRHIY